MNNSKLYIAAAADGSAHAVNGMWSFAICGRDGVTIDRDADDQPSTLDGDLDELTCDQCTKIVAERNGDESAADKAARAMATELSMRIELHGENSNVVRNARALNHLAVALRSIDGDDPEDASDALSEWVMYELGFDAGDERWEPVYGDDWAVIGIRYTLGGITAELKIEG